MLRVIFNLLRYAPTIISLIKQLSDLISKVGGDPGKDERKKVRQLKAVCGELKNRAGITIRDK